MEFEVFMNDMRHRLEWFKSNWQMPIGTETRALPPLAAVTTVCHCERCNFFRSKEQDRKKAPDYCDWYDNIEPATSQS